MKPTYNVINGRSSNTLLYCFDTVVITPEYPNGLCGMTTNLLKLEFWADDQQRRKVSAIGLQAAGDKTMTWIAPTWASSGSNTLKVTPVNWSLNQATGGRICLEMDKSTNMHTFCKGSNDGTCWAGFFDDSKNCCPLYLSSPPP
ncbi:hypothetical protein Vretifemale_6199 [Volvox reticuliferus]|uniref:Pherophorin domain-containing protein n=4 Tax=Volvox reticuliferus TaxID=1737510 RepID=A0A8J4C9C1_9CHLO|nr:hypothetical protein Vretifemale_6199 [Volvox reticuliferus]